MEDRNEIGNYFACEHRLTSFNLVLQGGGTIDEKLLESQTGVGNFEVQETHHVSGVMEIEHLRVPVVGRLDEIQQDIHHFHQELPGCRITFGIVRQDI